MFTRLKKVALDGAEFVIAALSIDQVETIVIAPLDAEDPNAAQNRVCETIAASLNRAGAASQLDEEEEWSAERVKSVLDVLTVDFLYAEIVAFTGLKKAQDAPVQLSAAAPATV